MRVEKKPERTNTTTQSLGSGIKDNYTRGTVADFLKVKIQEGSRLSVASAYFTIYAYDALKECLDKIEHLQFLFGEPRFVKSLDPDKTDKKSFRIEDDGLELVNRLEQKRVAKECADWIRAKVAIKSVKQSTLLHGKMYHIANAGVEDAILGSSNFTVRGLGLGPSNNNIELNIEVDSNRDRRDLKAWFNELWNKEELVEDVKQEVLQYLEQLYQNHAPEFIYYKTLFHIFEEFLAEQDKGGLLDQNVKVVDTQIWKALFEFQKDGVRGAINKILKHKGCIIADSVGLGKTFEALAIIKYFELKNDRVLVLCPKKLRENWVIYRNNDELNPFISDRFRYDVLSHTDLSRDSGKSGDIDLETINWGNYDLVVIDESHNFRNNTKGKRDEDGNIIRKRRYERLMEDIIQSGVKTKVLLLSATPVNNNLKDLRNQLYFLTEGRDDAFKDPIGVENLHETLRTAQQQFSQWAKQQSAVRRTSDLLERLSSAFFKLLDELTIARSRKHLSKYYKESVRLLGGFPERLKPMSISPDIDTEHKFMSYDQLNDEISNYQLSLFNPSKYLKPEYRDSYEPTKVQAFTQEDREHYLIGMMKVNFLKRLESSIESFEITMQRTIQKIDDLENKIQTFKRLQAENGELDVEELNPEALEDLAKDKTQLQRLYLASGEVTPDRDAKLKKLKELIQAKVKNPTTNCQGKPNRKVLVFTAFADTALYLYVALKDWATKELGIHIALLTGGTVQNRTSFGKNDFYNILTNFSPVAKNRNKMKTMPQQGEIDLLIATDCISEGQNLQDCDYLINYDIHWNPVRIIQRFGRIDRIGTINNKVQLINFWPTQDLNKYIDLKNRVEARMALVDIAATLEENILKPDEIEDLVRDELKYRDKQLLRLKDEVLDLEDFSESVALNEFTLDDFRIDLANYLESNRELLKDAPLGLYAVVPPPPNHPVIAPGVVFCLKQADPVPETEAVNPLHPYFLVYVRADKEVRYGFAQPKQILEIFRQLSAGKTDPYEDLCNLFNQETNNGADMATYSALLERAVDSITKTFKRRLASGLQSGRGFKLPDHKHQVTETTDFELITWLVIKEP